jgi:hypothetical protein
MLQHIEKSNDPQRTNNRTGVSNDAAKNEASFKSSPFDFVFANAAACDVALYLQKHQIMNTDNLQGRGAPTVA